MKTLARDFLYALLCFVFLGCQTEGNDSSNEYNALRDSYFFESTAEGMLVMQPLDCKGVAGSCTGVGLGLYVVPVQLKDGSVVMGVVTRGKELCLDKPVHGHLIFVSTDVFSKTRSFLP